MAYRRSLTTRARLFAQQRFAPSLSYLHREDDRKNQYSDEKVKTSLQTPSFGCFGNATNTSLGFGGGSFRDPRWSHFRHVPLTTNGFLLARNMSTIGDGSGAEKIEYMADMADVLTDKTMEVVSTQAPAVSEVAIAAADSWLPVAALQYAIDGIHNFTGLNWWTSIIVMTLVIRTLSVPIMINQLKAVSKITILCPELEQIKQEAEDRGMSPAAIDEAGEKMKRVIREEKMKRVFTERGVNIFTPWMGFFIQVPVLVSFFLAILNMVEKVPSFKTGGVFWFLDLTTADSFYILPFLTAFSFWIRVEFNMQEGLEGNPYATTRKNVSRGFAALIVPLTANFPKAFLFYWITSNLFFLVYGQIMKQHAVKKFLNVPIRVPPPPSPTSQIKNLEKEVKGRKKNKRR